MEIDINCDLGEGFGRWRMGDDAALMQIVSSANIACGYHAGDPAIMAATLALAKANGVAIGAHIGLPDLAGFGRVRMHIPAPELRQHALYQIGALQGMARLQKAEVTHASCHGALGNMTADDPLLAEAIAGAIADIGPELMIATSPFGNLGKAAAARGLRTAGKLLVDRGYTAQGKLVPRDQPGAMLQEIDAVRERVRLFLNEGVVRAVTGERLAIKAQTILIHGDGANAVPLAQAVRETIEREGGRIVPFTETLARQAAR